MTWQTDNPKNYATDYLRELDQVFPYVLNYGALYATPNNGRFRWVNAKTIEIPSVTTTGRINGDRDSVTFASRNYANTWETKTLTNERKWSTLVHPMDIDQTNMVASIGNITRVFNEEHKFPEMDAYLISKLYSDWSTSVDASTGHAAYVGRTADTTALTKDSILGVFDQLMLNMNEKRVPVQGRILYVTHAVKSMLKNAAGLDRTWDVQQANLNGINRAVEYLDGVQVIGVPAELMKTAYVFTNDWQVAAGADQINMFLVHPMAVITPHVYSFAQLDAPSAMSEGKYTYYEESFEDAFILNNKADALQFNITEAGGTTTE